MSATQAATKPKAKPTAIRTQRLHARRVLRTRPDLATPAAADSFVARDVGRELADKLLKNYAEKFYSALPSTRQAERVADDMRRSHRMGASAMKDSIESIVRIRGYANLQPYLSARSIQAILANPSI